MQDPVSKEDYELYTQKLISIVEAQQEAEKQILQGIGFDWRTSHRTDHGLITGHPLSGPATLKITLSTGRLIGFKRLYQFDIYGGMLCGMPNDPERHFIQAVNVAKEHFPNHGMPPIIFEPVFHAGQVARKGRDGGEIHVPWLKLPEVCTVVEFDSNSPARDVHEIYSSVLVIWFQDHYGLPDDARTLEQLCNLDWEKHGYDWTP